MIEIKNIKKTFKTKKGELTALNDVSINIEEGSIFGIIGLSGAGKTTLLRCIAGLETVDAGEIIIDGKNIDKILNKEKKDFKKNIGVVFQGINLLMMQDVFHNVAFPLQIDKVNKDKIKEIVNELCSLVGIKDKIEDYPAMLSGGQRQRVAIARALACNPKILLLDEITSALDPITTNQILKLLKDINKRLNVTMIIITHDMFVAKTICDHLAIIENGEIIEKGETNSIFTNPQSEFGKLLVESNRYV